MKEKKSWYTNAIFYEVSVKAFYDSQGDGFGDLRGLAERLDYLQDLGIDCIWILPIYPSPQNDDGYDVSDFYGVLEHFGTLDDFKYLIDQVHKRGMYLIADLILNHTSDQHPWFQEARQDRNSPYRDFYVWSDTDQKYQDARIIFLDIEASNWTWDETAGQYYWHRFFSSQPDLNFENPEVQQEMLNVLKFWLDLGIDGFRVDAVPYLFEREGTNCENLPETHQYLKRIRSFIDDHYPEAVLLCEANQWPRDVRPYFGDGDEFHLGFHFPLMPRIFMSLKREDPSSIYEILQQTPSIPENCQWCTFLRNHDELTLEMVTEKERQWMWQQYAPEERMRLNLGIRRRLAPLLDGDQERINLAFAIQFGLPGNPVIYYGDEIGMGDNIWLADRDGVRTPMQWNKEDNAGFSSVDSENLYLPLIEEQPFSFRQVNAEAAKLDSHSGFHVLKEMIQIRKQNPVFASGELAWESPENTQLLVFRRMDESSEILAIYNISTREQSINIPLVQEINSFSNLYCSFESGNIQLIKNQKGHNLEGKIPASGFTWLKLKA